jgi:hypothetical protein
MCWDYISVDTYYSAIEPVLWSWNYLFRLQLQLQLSKSFRLRLQLRSRLQLRLKLFGYLFSQLLNDKVDFSWHFVKNIDLFNFLILLNRKYD